VQHEDTSQQDQEQAHSEVAQANEWKFFPVLGRIEQQDAVQEHQGCTARICKKTPQTCRGLGTSICTRHGYTKTNDANRTWDEPQSILRNDPGGRATYEQHVAASIAGTDGMHVQEQQQLTPQEQHSHNMV